MANGIGAAAAAVPDAVLAPAKTAKAHPYVVIGVFVILAVFAVVMLESRRPGRVRDLVFRIPGLGPWLTKSA